MRELPTARRTTRQFYEFQIITSEAQLAVIFGRRVVVGHPNVSNFLFPHPEEEWVISTFAEKDTTAEFGMIHPPDVVEKYAPGATTGSLGEGGEDDDDEDDGSSVMAKRKKKGDVWEVLNGRVLNVSIFLSQNPDGELVMLTFAGKDATAEFDVIQPPYVVEKYAPGAIIGVVGSGKAKKTEGAGKSAPVATDKGYANANLEEQGDRRMEDCDDTPRVILVSVRSYVSACHYLVLNVIHEIWPTNLAAKNFKISSDRTGPTRSAVFLVFHIVVVAVGNRHVFKRPDDLNGNGYFHVRVCWTGVDFQVNIVQEYVLLSALLHIFVGLKRTSDQKLSQALMSSQLDLNLAVTGLMLLTFMTIHLSRIAPSTNPHQLTVHFDVLLD